MGDYKVIVEFSNDDEEGYVAKDVLKALEGIVPYMGDNVVVTAYKQVVGGKKSGSWQEIATNVEDDLAKDKESKAKQLRVHAAAEAYNQVMDKLNIVRDFFASDYADCAGSEEDFTAWAQMLGTTLIPIVERYAPEEAK